MIKVSGVFHKSSKQSDPRLAWLMLHRIYPIYCDINVKEERNDVMLLTSMSENI